MNFKITSIIKRSDLGEFTIEEGKIILKDKRIIDFFDLYKSDANFPDSNERENEDDIINRIVDRGNHDFESSREVDTSNPDPYTHLLCFEVFDSASPKQCRLVGGCIVEFYPDSCCILITYVFVDEKFRGALLFGECNEDKTESSVSKMLLFQSPDGLVGLIQKIEKDYHKKIKAVLFESNDPLKTAKDSLPPYKRLDFFRKLGAKRINFNYVQPPLDDEKQNVDNLYLLTFPMFVKENGRYLSILTLMSFLLEFTKSLEAKKSGERKQLLEQYVADKKNLSGIAYEITEWEKLRNHFKSLEEIIRAYIKPSRHQPVSAARKSLEKMFQDLARNTYNGTQYIYLEEIPRTEEPKFLLSRASITIQVLVDEDYFEPVSITLTKRNGHWVENKLEDDHLELSDEVKTSIRYCTVCHSYETDLFSYQNQINPPFFTKVFKQNIAIRARFPESIKFTSEGRREEYLTNQSGILEPNLWCAKWAREPLVVGADETDASIAEKFDYMDMRLFVSYTYFPRSNIRVWNLSFSPTEDGFFSEFALIKLAKFFTGTQENRSQADKETEVLDKICFSISENGSDTNEPKRKYKPLIQTIFPKGGNEASEDGIGVSYLLSKEGKKKQAANGLRKIINKENPFWTPFFGEELNYTNIKTGITHIDMSQDFVQVKMKMDRVDFSSLLCDLFGYIYDNVKHKQIEQEDSSRLEQSDRTKTEKRTEDQLANMLCGVTLGIFDYDRMGLEEIDDTLSPRPASVTEKSFLSLNRGNLSSYNVREMDNLLNSAWHTLGASPYLLIPSAVLAHNEYVTMDAEDRLEQLIKMDSKNKRAEIASLVSERDMVNDLLQDDFISNPFHYKTEKDLFAYGMEHRGINQRYLDSLSKLTQVDTIIEQKIHNRDNNYQKIVQFVLAVIAITAMHPVIVNFMGDNSNKLENWKITHSIFIGVALFTMATIVYFTFYSLEVHVGVGIDKKKANKRKAGRKP